MAAMDESKVYCLFRGSYSDRYLVGVFESLSDAQSAHDHDSDGWRWVESQSGIRERYWFHQGPAINQMGLYYGDRYGLRTCDADIEERVLVRSIVHATT